ncbi:MAG: TonB-dependent receptor [Sphingomonadaceae bacterium]|nr:TonB-dependent receptor [Sphingomonadaceae bacterium]
MRSKAFLLAGAASAMIAFPAQAQDAGEDEKDVIIVTATLRAADVQDIPIAVTAVQPVELERQGIADIKSLSSLSPSFNIQSSQTETQGTSIKIRGVGTTGNNTGLESSVGVFIDGIYQSRPGVALGDLMDLERLEVLRGPQGTLFGRNTSAGALNITTRRPSLTEADGFVNASYGNYDFINIQAGVGVPIVQDTAAVRFSGSYRKRDGYLKSTTGAESNNRDRYMLRGQLYAEPSPDVSIRILADYSKVDENCCDAVIIRETELAPFAAFHGLPNTGAAANGFGALEDLRTNSQLFINISKQWGVSGELKWDLGGAQLTYIGSYRDFSSESTQESDFVSLNVFTAGRNGSNSLPGQPKNGDNIETMTHELRLQGDAFDGKLDWLIGAFYATEDIAAQGVLTLGSDFQRAGSAFNFANLAGVNPLFTLTAFGNGGVPVNATGGFATNLFTQDAQTYSFFTHNVFDLTDNLSITLGARWVNERKDGKFDQLAASNPACQASVTGVLNGGVPAPLRAGLVGLNCFPFTAPVNLVAPAALGGGLASNLLPLPREFDLRFKDDALTYTGQLTYKPTEDTMIYGSFSHGFKSGGFNLDPTAANIANSAAVLASLGTATPVAPVFADPRFKSEKVDAFELGFKGTFGRVNANLALFHMDMKDFQVLEFTGVQFTTFNVDSAKSTGAELEIFGRVTDSFSINAAATYADARYPSGCDTNAAPGVAISIGLLCGQPLTNAPKFTGVLGATYDGDLGSTGWGLVVNANMNYSSKRRTTTQHLELNATTGAVAELPFDYQNAYAKINARIGLTTPDDVFTFELWATNLTNKITRGVTANTSLRGGVGTRSRIGFVEEPRFYGMTVRAKF